MKLLLRFLLCFCGFALIACTSQEGVLKKQAKELGEQKMKAAFRLEADELLKQSVLLHDGYIDFMNQTSEVKVEEVRVLNENLATVTVTMTTIPLKVRRTLLEIAAKVEPAKSRRFNFSEAVSLIRKQMGDVEEKDVQPLGIYHFRKSQNNWVTE